MYEIKNPTQLRIQLTFGRFRSSKRIFKWNLRNVHTADGWISFNVLYSSGSSCFTMCPMLLYCMLNFSRLQSAFNSTTLNENKIFFRVAFCQTFCIMIINRISPFIDRPFISRRIPVNICRLHIMDSPLISGTPRVMLALEAKSWRPLTIAIQG